MPRLQQDEEKSHLMHSHSEHDSMDSSSIRSFASSSTLTNSLMTPDNLDEEKTFGLLAQGSEFTSTQTQSHSWHTISLSMSDICFLLFIHLPTAIIKPLLPSFIFTSPPRKLHSTSYLDGLRGIAALIVFVDHFVLNWYYDLRNGYLSSPTDTYILQLPIIRLIFAGRASVGIFFVISGFVLSHKPLLLIRSGDKAAVLTTLSSSIFRRSIRLYLPILAGTFISMNLANYGHFTPVPSRGELIPPMLPTWTEQVHHWWFSCTELSFPFWSRGVDPNKPYGPPYNGHLWTIPIEFYGSMVVFLVLLATSGARSGAVRMRLVSVLASWSLKRGRWDVFNFLGGVVLAEWSLICYPSSIPYSTRCSSEADSFPSHHEYELESTRNLTLDAQPKAHTTLPLLFRPIYILRKQLNFLFLLFSLYLLSYAGESPSPGIYHVPLIPWTPDFWEPVFLGREHFWLSLGSLLLIFCLVNSPTLQRPFTCSFAQYLGGISYSLYIIHGMVLFTIGTYMQERWTGQVGEERWVDNGIGELVEAVVRMEKMEVGSWEFGKACGLTGVVCMVVVFWVADLFWRVVDRGSVGFGRWIEGVFKGRGR